MANHTSRTSPAGFADFTTPAEALLRQDLRDYAAELWQLAYTLPNGVGEHAFLQLSGRIRAAADQVIAKRA